MRQRAICVVLAFLTMAAVVGAPMQVWAQEKPKPAPLKLKVGDEAPDFTLKYYDGAKLQNISLHEFRGKKNVLVAFFVFAFTGGWTTEMRNLQQNYQKLEAADTQVVGVSVDSPFANKAFADSLNVTFPMASDYFDDFATTKEYGLWEPKYKAARRATFLVGKDGKIEEIQADSEAIDPTKVVQACERKKKG